MILSLLPFSSLSRPPRSCRCVSRTMSPPLPPDLVPILTLSQSLASFLLVTTGPLLQIIDSELSCGTVEMFYHSQTELNLQRIYGNKNWKPKGKQYFIPTITSCLLSLFFPKCLTHGESQIPVLILRPESSIEAEERERKAWKSQPPHCSWDETVASRLHREHGLESVTSPAHGWAGWDALDSNSNCPALCI